MAETGPGRVSVSVTVDAVGGCEVTLAVTVRASLAESRGDDSLLGRVRRAVTGGPWTDDDDERFREAVEAAVTTAAGEFDLDELFFDDLHWVERAIERAITDEWAEPPVQVEAVTVEEVRPDRHLVDYMLQTPRRGEPNDALTFPGDRSVDDLLVIGHREVQFKQPADRLDQLREHGVDVEEAVLEPDAELPWVAVDRAHPVFEEIDVDPDAEWRHWSLAESIRNSGEFAGKYL